MNRQRTRRALRKIVRLSLEIDSRQLQIEETCKLLGIDPSVVPEMRKSSSAFERAYLEGKRDKAELCKRAELIREQEIKARVRLGEKEAAVEIRKQQIADDKQARVAMQLKQLEELAKLAAALSGQLGVKSP